MNSLTGKWQAPKPYTGELFDRYLERVIEDMERFVNSKVAPDDRS